MIVTLVKIEKINGDIKTFWFKPEAKFSYVAGQFIEMYLPHNDPDERGEKHWFTLSSSPSEQLISITTRFANPGSSFKTKLASLKTGDTIKISEPMGDFVLPKDKTRPLVFVAGGIGVTPFRSMIKWLTDTGEKRKIGVLFSVNYEKDLVFRKLIEAYVGSFTPIITNPPNGWEGETGRLDAGRILTSSKTSETDSLFYISGPEPMVESLTHGLNQVIEEHRIISDYFPGYQAV